MIGTSNSTEQVGTHNLISAYSYASLEYHTHTLQEEPSPYSTFTVATLKEGKRRYNEVL